MKSNIREIIDFIKITDMLNGNDVPRIEKTPEEVKEHSAQSVADAVAMITALTGAVLHEGSNHHNSLGRFLTESASRLVAENLTEMGYYFDRDAFLDRLASTTEMITSAYTDFRDA